MPQFSASVFINFFTSHVKHPGFPATSSLCPVPTNQHPQLPAPRTPASFHDERRRLQRASDFPVPCCTLSRHRHISGPAITAIAISTPFKLLPSPSSPLRKKILPPKVFPTNIYIYIYVNKIMFHQFPGFPFQRFTSFASP